jgi:hypothetical protein
MKFHLNPLDGFGETCALVARTRGKLHNSFLCLFQPLPEVFAGVRLVLPDEVAENRSELLRYFIAYPFERTVR